MQSSSTNRYPDIWPYRQRIGYELDQLFYILRPLIRRASRRRWGKEWLLQVLELTKSHKTFRVQKEVELDLRLCLLLAKVFWQLPQIEDAIRIRHRWAHQKAFSKAEYGQAIKHLDSLKEMLQIRATQERDAA